MSPTALVVRVGVILGRSEARRGRTEGRETEGKKMTQGQYSFPLLSNGDIIGCIEELGSDLREQELLRPTYEVLRPVYENLVMMLVGMTREELHQPVVTAMDGMEYPEMHEDSIVTMQFNKALMALMRGSGIHDFTLKDIHKPEYTRTRRNLSALINFAKFREEKLTFFNEMQEQSEVCG